MSWTKPPSRSLSSKLAHAAVLLGPVVLLVLLGYRQGNWNLTILAAAGLVFAAVFYRQPNAWRPPTSGPVLLAYLLLLAGTVWLTRGQSDPLAAAVRGLLLLGSVLLLAGHDLYRTGAEPRRRAKKWCARLQARQTWPGELADIRHLPEVHSLRDAAAGAPGPVFDLFRDPRPQVRAAAFSAFINRGHWRPREAGAVLEETRASKEPGVRVAGITALASIDDPDIALALADFFLDPSSEVRAAAVQASLAENGRRWPVVRDSVRGLLGDPRGIDTALPGSAGLLPVVAICDLSAWAAEPEPLGQRCVRTLVEHYDHQLQATGDYDLVTDLTNQVLDPGTPTVLRVELAGLLRRLNLLTPELLDRMTNADQPGPVRLLAAEAMLSHDQYHPDGLDVLRGLGRQPNREMALTIAAILQSRLGIDLGLPPQGLAPNSKAAGDVAKRVMAWAVSRGGDRRLPTPIPDVSTLDPLIPKTPPPSNFADLQPVQDSLIKTGPPRPKLW